MFCIQEVVTLLVIRKPSFSRFPDQNSLKMGQCHLARHRSGFCPDYDGKILNVCI